MKQALITSSIYSILFLCNFFFAEQIRKHFVKFQELSRKAVHVFSGLIALTFPYYIKSHWVVLILVSIFSLLMLITKKKNLLKSIHEVGRKSYGSFYYPLAIYLIFLLAKDSYVIYFTSILIMTVSDAFAAIVGKKYGTIKYEVEGNIKSLEGSISFLFITFICVLLPLLLMTSIGNLEAILISFIISSVLTGLEAISPTGSDNIIIPFGTFFLLSKMINLPISLITQDFSILLVTIFITATISLLKPSGLIGLMLINYGALTLGNIYWFLPLFITELLISLFIIFSLNNNIKEKFPIRVLFYLGIIPTILLFMGNIFEKNSIIFISYLVSIVSQLPITFFNYRKWIKKSNSFVILYAIIALLFVTILSLQLYFKSLNITLILVILFSSLFTFFLNKILVEKFAFNKCEKAKYRIRSISTICGSLLAFLLFYQGVINVF